MTTETPQPQRKTWETPLLIDLSTSETESGAYVSTRETVRSTPSGQQAFYTPADS